MQAEGFSSIWMWKHSPSLPLEEHRRTLPQAPLPSHPRFLLPGSSQNLQRDEKGLEWKRQQEPGYVSFSDARSPKAYNYFRTWTQVLKVLRSLKYEHWVNVYTVNLQSDFTGALLNGFILQLNLALKSSGHSWTGG